MTAPVTLDVVKTILTFIWCLAVIVWLGVGGILLLRWRRWQAEERARLSHPPTDFPLGRIVRRSR